MKGIPFLTILGIAIAALLAVNAAEQANSSRTLAGWGTVIDEDGDCQFTVEKRGLKITVPGRVHDLFPPNSLMNAPRVLTSVAGDFTVQLKVTADFDPGDTPAEGFNRAFHGAGLLLWQDESNYFRFERGELYWPNTRVHRYFAPSLQLRLGGQYIEQLGPPSRTAPVFTEPHTFLKVQRKGGTLTAWYSRDGDYWQKAREFEVFSGKKIRVGVYAVNTAGKEFTATFEGFKVTEE